MLGTLVSHEIGTNMICKLKSTDKIISYVPRSIFQGQKTAE